MTDNINNILLANIHLGLVVLVSWIIVRLPSGPGMFMSKNDPLQLQIISDVKQQSKLHLETNFHQLASSNYPASWSGYEFVDQAELWSG